jgi:16S rRNA (cytidine1402-2'-O)-methyltransferase
MNTGTLFLIPCNICDPFAIDGILPRDVIITTLNLNYFIVENAKTSRAFLKAIGISRPLQEVHISELDPHSSQSPNPEILQPLLSGFDMGLMSEAGAPAVADPGSTIVGMAHARNIRVEPLVGPSSILLGLMASGLNGQRFAFHGYLPQEKKARQNTLLDLERESRQRKMTQLFIETPYRNHAMWIDLLATLNKETRLCVAATLTSPEQFVATKSVSDWRKLTYIPPKVPALYLFLA